MDGITTRNPIMDVPELIPMEDYDPFRVSNVTIYKERIHNFAYA